MNEIKRINEDIDDINIRLGRVTRQVSESRSYCVGGWSGDKSLSYSISSKSGEVELQIISISTADTVISIRVDGEVNADFSGCAAVSSLRIGVGTHTVGISISGDSKGAMLTFSSNKLNINGGI